MRNGIDTEWWGEATGEPARGYARPTSNCGVCQSQQATLDGGSVERFAEINLSAESCGESLAEFLENAIEAKLAVNANLVSRARKFATETPIAPPSIADGDEGRHLLVSGNDRTEDGIWAAADGRLFIHDGHLKTQPREVSFDQAADFWRKFHQGEPYLDSPFFPEKTDAALFTSMVNTAIKAKKLAEVPDLPVGDATQTASGNDLNTPVDLESLQSLVADGCGSGSDGLWAAPDGRLY